MATRKNLFEIYRPFVHPPSKRVASPGVGDISTRLKAVQPNIRVSLPGRGKRFYFRPQSVHTGLGPTQPRTQWAHGAISLGMNWTGREADHSLPYNSEVTNEWNSTYTTPYAFMACTWTSLFLIFYLYALSKHINYLF
jgi:hypothetical protein